MNLLWTSLTSQRRTRFTNAGKIPMMWTRCGKQQNFFVILQKNGCYIMYDWDETSHQAYLPRLTLWSTVGNPKLQSRLSSLRPPPNLIFLFPPAQDLQRLRHFTQTPLVLLLTDRTTCRVNYTSANKLEQDTRCSVWYNTDLIISFSVRLFSFPDVCTQICEHKLLLNAACNPNLSLCRRILYLIKFKRWLLLFCLIAKIVKGG